MPSARPKSRAISLNSYGFSSGALRKDFLLALFFVFSEGQIFGYNGEDKFFVFLPPCVPKTACLRFGLMSGAVSSGLERGKRRHKTIILYSSAGSLAPE